MEEDDAPAVCVAAQDGGLQPGDGRYAGGVPDGAAVDVLDPGPVAFDVHGLVLNGPDETLAGLLRVGDQPCEAGAVEAPADIEAVEIICEDRGQTSCPLSLSKIPLDCGL